ncbi:MAG: 16S rRNA (adenine(1518)-N(6)/adenine(1519)-N(6))-dimethyltransferase RsmA [Puniceicoccales bacterium]|jgi:16S rRNA (adenine1518-N6/adenine1519-N6)-dimethyltransferase|nr:16S rRNA (adenine(1518)-N(6)/adenine(1519)-N(6))-dimethyltransferase RsmA [Puniceicoccales bacterium]
MPIISELGPLSRGQTQLLLKSLEKFPRKRLGQNFLIDKNIIFKSLQLAGPLSGENVIEIGPGLGSLTRALLGAGCHVFAIECDKILCEFLVNELGHLSRFYLVGGDAVERPLAGFEGRDEPFKIIANLPYNISTPWLSAVLERSELPVSMTLMLQREAAARFLSQPGSKQWSAISIFLHSAYVCEGIFPVSRASFWPVPAVDSVLIHLKRLEVPRIFHRETRSLIRKIFTQRRKQIGSLIKLFLPQFFDEIGELLLKNDLDLSLRPEQIPSRFWHNFDNFLHTREL